MLLVDTKKLELIMRDVLSLIGLNVESTEHLVSSIIQTSLRGVDSHGINLFPYYVNAIKAGRINKKPKFSIEETAVSAAIIDADHATGHHAGRVAVLKAVKMAKQTGISAVSVKNSEHFGAAAYFSLAVAEQDCLGFSFTNADALVKAFGSKEAFFGTNPICFCAPMEKEAPFCLDMATSLVSWNKIENYKRNNEIIPSHWAYDEEGKSVTVPKLAASLAPIGEYKGYGLAMMIEILCSIITNGTICKDLKKMYESPMESGRNLSHFFMVIDIEKFVDVTLFKRNLQTMIDRIRCLPTEDGVDEVLVAGDPEKKVYRLRSKEGLPLDKKKFEEFLELSKEFSESVIRYG